MLNDVFPLRVEAVPAARASEWRADDSFPPRQTQAWQLIYVRSGTIEERCDDRRVLLRAGGLLFHQPGEVFAMTTVGRSRPKTLRIDFTVPARRWIGFAVRSCTLSRPSSTTWTGWPIPPIRCLTPPPCGASLPS